MFQKPGDSFKINVGSNTKRLIVKPFHYQYLLQSFFFLEIRIQSKNMYVYIGSVSEELAGTVFIQESVYFNQKTKEYWTVITGNISGCKNAIQKFEAVIE